MSENSYDKRYARVSYLSLLLPDQLRIDPHVNHVALSMVDRDDFTIEACLTRPLARQLRPQPRR